MQTTDLINVNNKDAVRKFLENSYEILKNFSDATNSRPKAKLVSDYFNNIVKIVEDLTTCTDFLTVTQGELNEKSNENIRHLADDDDNGVSNIYYLHAHAGHKGSNIRT